MDAVAPTAATGAGGFLIVSLLLILAIYFIPTIIAVKKNHLQKTAIVLINVLLGWTFLGWVVALVWAVLKEKSEIYKRRG